MVAFSINSPILGARYAGNSPMLETYLAVIPTGTKIGPCNVQFVPHDQSVYNCFSLQQLIEEIGFCPLEHGLNEILPLCLVLDLNRFNEVRHE